jgi:hypothetical protein
MSMVADRDGEPTPLPAPEDVSSHIAASVRPSEAQRRYLRRGLEEPGGKLPLFDRSGREVPKATIQACIAHGWATAWVANPIKPDWLVCRLTDAGYRVLKCEPPIGEAERNPEPPGSKR